MPQSLSHIQVHMIFSTKNRRPYIRKELAPRLHGYLGGILTRLDCIPIEIGGTEDHVHLFFVLTRNHSVSSLVNKVKSRSTAWVRRIRDGEADFNWQLGYGSFSVSFSHSNQVRTYIQRQEFHHRKMSFQDEFRLAMKRHNQALDERYAWD